MVLREVQPAVGQRQAEVERKILAEPMLELDLEAEEIDIELARLLLVEHSQDRGDGSKHCGHRRLLETDPVSLIAIIQDLRS